MKSLVQKTGIVLIAICLFAMSNKSYGQFEWRLTNGNFNSADPDAGGPATGSVTFTIQIRTIAGTIDITGMTTGFAWQDANALVPTGVPCGSTSASQPSNISMSPSFPGYTYNQVNECSGMVNFITDGQTFDRRSVGTVDGGSAITIGTTWVDVFTVTLWSRNSTNPQAGYVVINSTNAGTPGPFSNYDISDALANVYDANSLTYTTALPLVSGTLPVLFTKYNVLCNDKGALLTWTTASEQNSKHFEIQKSADGSSWETIDLVAAAGNSTDERNYQYLDLEGGAAFYRIRQVDFDGRFMYTSVKQASCKGSLVTVALFPVPVKDNLTIVIRTERAAKTDLVVTDVSGRVVRRVNTQLIKGSNNIVMDLSNLPAGQYLLSGSNPEIIINKKFVVAR